MVDIDGWTSHQPILLACCAATKGDILDFGCGYYSTPLLHAMFPNRYILSMDYNEEWLDRFKYMECEYHAFIVANFKVDPEEIFNCNWSIAFIDHGIVKTRMQHIRILRDKADIIVVHDTNRAVYGYDFREFKYQFHYARWPQQNVAQTTALSMKIDLGFLESLL